MTNHPPKCFQTKQNNNKQANKMKKKSMNYVHIYQQFLDMGPPIEYRRYTR